MKAITLTLHVDPAAAVRAGNAHCGETTITLTEEDLSKLSEDQRDTLARHLAHEEPWSKPLTDRITLDSGWEPIKIGRADFATVLELLDRRRGDIARRKKELQERSDKAARNAIDEASQPANLWIVTNEAGAIIKQTAYTHPPREYPGEIVHGPFKAPKLANRYFPGLSDGLKDDLVTYNIWARRQIELAIEAAGPAIAEKVAKRQEVRELEREQKVLEAEEYEAFLSRLPEITQKRIGEDYCTEEEEKALIVDLIRTDAGLSCEPFGYDRPLDALTDGQYEQLLAVRQRIEGMGLAAADVCAVTLYDWCECVEANEDSAFCDVCVGEGGINPRLAVMVKWYRAGLPVVATFPLK